MSRFVIPCAFCGLTREMRDTIPMRKGKGGMLCEYTTVTALTLAGRDQLTPLSGVVVQDSTHRLPFLLLHLGHLTLLLLLSTFATSCTLPTIVIIVVASSPSSPSSQL